MSFSDELGITLGEMSAYELVVLVGAVFLASLSGLALLVASLLRMSRRNGGVAALAVVVLELFGGLATPVVTYWWLDRELMRYGAHTTLLFVWHLWFPASFILLLVFLVNVVLTIQMVRAGRQEPRNLART